MRAPATNHEFGQAVSAARAVSLAATAIDRERRAVSTGFAIRILKRGEGGAAPFQAAVQDVMDRPVQAFDFVLGETAGRPFRVQAGQKERLIDVDVAETGDQSLIEQHTLQLTGAPGEAGREHLRRELIRQRFGTETPVQSLDVSREEVEHPAELPLVREPEIVPVVELDCQVLEPEPGSVPRDDAQLAGHAEMNHQG